MTPSEYENYLVSLTDEQYDDLIQERITRLDPEQQKIAQAREVQRKYQRKLLFKASCADTSEDDLEGIYNALCEAQYNCEHAKPAWKHCFACGKIDYLMFPEFFDENGFRNV